MALKKISKKNLVVLVSVFCLEILHGCSGSTVRGNNQNYSLKSAIEEAKDKNTPDSREFQNLTVEYRKGLHESVIRRAKTFSTAYPKSVFVDQVANLRGLSHIALKQYQFAIAQFKTILEGNRSPELSNMVNYNLAYVYFELGQIPSAKQHLDQINTQELEKSDRYKFHILNAKVTRVTQDYAQSTADVLQAIKLLPEPRTKAALDPLLNFLDEVIENVDNVVVLEKLLSQNEDSPAIDHLIYKIGLYHFRNGDKDRSKAFFQKIVSDFPDSTHFTTSNDYLKKLSFQALLSVNKVGVVLTLSGKLSKFGYKALQGIELAFKIFSPEQKTNSIQLVVMDDQGDPDRAVLVMEELFYKHHVVAVVGPLSSKLADPMAAKAQELGLPLISLTQKESLKGDFIFNTALTPAIQTRELVRYATEKLHLNRFAIMAPSTRFGEEYVKAFWDELDKNACFVHGYETYTEGETDFRSNVDNLIGLNQTDAREKEVEELRLLKAANPIKNRSKKFDKMFELGPVVDFDAVFIPDEPKTLGQILPTFAYRDVERITFLGINTWNSRELLARAGQFAEGSVFVDGFYAGSNQPATKRFIEEFENVFQATPGLVEAISYDAGHILSWVLMNEKISSRSDLKNTLKTLKDFPGLAGKISYESGRLTKQLYFLTVRNGNIEEIAFQ